MCEVKMNKAGTELEILPTTIEDWTPETAFEYLNAWGWPYTVEDNGNGTYLYNETIITAEELCEEANRVYNAN